VGRARTSYPTWQTRCMGYIPNMTPGERARWAILQEVTAIKAGNVHPRAVFAEMGIDDFRLAAEVIAEAFDRTAHESLGATILAAATAMMDQVGTNTSLGTILLLAPMAKWESCANEGTFHSSEQVRSQLSQLLEGTDGEASQRIYTAIDRCRPGGLGRLENMDVTGEAPESILQAMRMAASWDDIALQYANGFENVFVYARSLTTWVAEGSSLLDAIRRLQGEAMADRPDSLIVRKHGVAMGQQVQARARQMVSAGAYGSPEYETAWEALDAFLRDPRARKNPGTTADMIAAALYAVSAGWT